MRIRLTITPLRWYERFLDVLMVPLMWLVGTSEGMNRTHFWNNKKLKQSNIRAYGITLEEAVYSDPDPQARPAWFLWIIPLMHMARFGGWREYIVLEPEEMPPDGWHIGWVSGKSAGVSRIRLHGKVRVLRGPGHAHFFAVTKDGKQIPLEKVWYGRIGNGGLFAKTTLV